MDIDVCMHKHASLQDYGQSGGMRSQEIFRNYMFSEIASEAILEQ